MTNGLFVSGPAKGRCIFFCFILFCFERSYCWVVVSNAIVPTFSMIQFLHGHTHSARDQWPNRGPTLDLCSSLFHFGCGYVSICSHLLYSLPQLLSLIERSSLCLTGSGSRVLSMCFWIPSVSRRHVFFSITRNGRYQCCCRRSGMVDPELQGCGASATPSSIRSRSVLQKYCAKMKNTCPSCHRLYGNTIVPCAKEWD